ncbi:Gfo/Idh/MocA family protein [Paenibacillus nasutitermitis]|uniref:Oxidoreductase n=1 Tax=Paenibacillus nasutitermitis TaxID=1652958 RepID=A0A916YTJ5_9BACL|nr:Gfo/Idh/MocA family oxidoreductase [Paenibacillus nasutitermitis]GGD59895.1 oxidoreductase [Paenibacillus nasutitermitis]
MGLKIGVVGAGQFAPCFIPLFQAHPNVDEVYLAELVPERLQKTAETFGIKQTFGSLEELCRSDVDAVAIYTQRHLHGEQTLQALRAGKHVYCAVPMAQTYEEMSAIIVEVAKSRLIYMTGETSYYYPSTIYARDRFAKGDFGDFVYGEAQYIHDMDHGFYDAYRYSGGEQWKRTAGIPPMYYPTHSVSMILSVTGARATKVACLGYVDKSGDGVFGKGNNLWDNPYSNQTALVRTSDGGMGRFNEFRRAGWAGKNSVYMSMFGTEGSFEEHGLSQVWTTLSHELTDVSDLLDCPVHYRPEGLGHVNAELQADFMKGMAKIHPVERLPKTFENKQNGHFGSHQFLVDDFVKSIASGDLPPNHAWNAAKYCAPGLAAHESSLKDGEWLELPDFGSPPADWRLLDPYRI